MRYFLQMLLVLLVASVFASHPCIYTSEEQKSELKNKIRSHKWAAENYKSVKSSVEEYVRRHETDPEWIVSRLQMYWNNKYEDVYVNGSVYSHGEGEAPVPTPKFAGGRDWAVDYMSPSLEDIKPYMDDERGMWLRNGKKEGNPWEWAPLEETGQIIERINERIMTLAQNAAFVYWFTGDESYAEFAADIFWTYTYGMHHRSNPKFYKDDRSRQIIGLATFEVIHEAITVPMAVCYDYIRGYLKENDKDIRIVEDVFKRWTDRIIEGGGAEGNWNINQARFIVYMALALEDNDAYENGKGRQYYLDAFLKTSRPNQKALPDVVNDEYDPDNAIWDEAPGYAFSTTQNIIKLARIIQNATGRDVLKEFPTVEKAYLAYFQYLFPNGYSVGFGDAYHEKPQAEPLELLIALYRQRGNKQMEASIIAALKEKIEDGYDRAKNNSLLSLTTYTDELADAGEGEANLQTPTYYSRPVNMFIQRNGKNPRTALCATLTGTAGGHVHANGMTAEFYGCGMVMAPDSGRGTSYWQAEQGEYYARFPAHNTVVVDGVSDYNPHHGQKSGDLRYAAYRINACEPQSESPKRINENVSFIDASFTEPKTAARQRRKLAIVRTSKDSGYYVDIFRSARQDGEDKFHDYIYHNIGELTSLERGTSKAVDWKQTSLLTSKRGLLKAYDYFEDERSAAFDGDFSAVFEAEDAAMKIWAGGFENTMLFKASSPKSRAALKGSIPKALEGERMPTLIIRREGEAWSKPFVNIFEPYRRKNGTSVRDVRISQKDGLIAVKVNSESSKQYIFSSDCDYRRFKFEGMEFEGEFAVVNFDNSGELEYLYLGSGRFLKAGEYYIDGGEELVSAGLYMEGEKVNASANKSVRVRLPVKSDNVSVKVAGIDNAGLKPHYLSEDGNIGLTVRILECYNVDLKRIGK